MARRITEGVERGGEIRLTVNGTAVSAYAGETIATLLLAAGITAFNTTRSGQARAPFCNMGTCFECQVRVADPGSAVYRWRRACMCPVQAGMAIVTGARLSHSAAGHDED
jgi:sarcosine oxidase subunit alpha